MEDEAWQKAEEARVGRGRRVGLGAIGILEIVEYWPFSIELEFLLGDFAVPHFYSIFSLQRPGTGGIPK